LPTRRELYQYINGDVSDEDEEDKSYLNTKRYFLKSKRYFLNSKRDNERQEVSDSFFYLIFFEKKLGSYLIFPFL
jgi:hypothetical protein